MSDEVRNHLLKRLELDLVGPLAPEEVLSDLPSDRYLSGILYPQRCAFAPEDDDKLPSEDADEEETGQTTASETMGLATAMRPASMGISFAAVALGNDRPTIRLIVSCATYTPIEHAPKDGNTNAPAGLGKQTKRFWKRIAHEALLSEIVLTDDHPPISLKDYGLPGLELYIQTAGWNSGNLVTVALVNTHEITDEDSKIQIQEKSFFQTKLEVLPVGTTRFPARPSRKSALDEDGRAAALLYRDVREFAVGHTSSAEWTTDDQTNASRVATTWVPRQIVRAISSEGDEAFGVLTASDDLRPLSAEWLASSEAAVLISGLEMIPDAYEVWIAKQVRRIETLPHHLQSQAAKHLNECRATAAMMREGIQLIASDENIRLAFQLSNRAMLIQRGWTYRNDPSLTWRPFQIAFLLLTIPSVAMRNHPDRDVMDLLWFPTGGGKTEAYLALVAFIVMHRRFRQDENADRGAGVGALMRYTLRLLTTQQFQRAAALTAACEVLRRKFTLQDGTKPRFGSKPFSIGLWVGDSAVPNSVSEAARALRDNLQSTPAQIERCPACNKKLWWRANAKETAIRVSCTNEDCELYSATEDLPIWTVDEDVYREKPSLVIGTIDKFAQIPRKLDTGTLFGLVGEVDHPDVIIQDELHLISGPLGTMAGVYEVAIDILCSQAGVVPKVIGSTATIRRAEDQIRSLFNRRTRQFPPPGIDASNSGFAAEDASAPGRLYIGITTAGRSAKFTLQGVSASLLQSAASLSFSDAERDPYWTLVAYFNSLRELGGALVLMQDDVGDSLKEFAGRRSEPQREAKITDELTSRVSQVEIRNKLHELTRRAGEPGAIDVLLASNMISVGMDIPRLGLMVVNGQPKGIAEYIQATSRVGRGRVPGLVVCIYNNAKARDRSHYETFATWHSSLYREVESTSVTPFSSRARERTLHAVLVALVRLLVPDMHTKPVLSATGQAAAQRFSKAIIDRVQRVDAEEVPGVTQQLDAIIIAWQNRYQLKQYWNDRGRSSSLLISAEAAAALRANGRLPGEAWPTPNSMRNVEPGTPFTLVEHLAVQKEVDSAAE